MSKTPDGDEEARRRRAKRLREEIEQLKSEDEPGPEPDEGEETPRDFIERKMREEREKDSEP